MHNRKRFLLTVCMLLCAFLLAGLASASAEEASDAPLAELHLEKNGLPLDLTLQNLAVEDGNLAFSIGIEGITGWKDETPPKLLIVREEPHTEFKLDLFTTATVKALPDSVKNYKMSTKLPYDGTALPDQILILVGEDEALLFWPQESGTVPESAEESEGKADKELKSAGTDEDAQEALDEAKALLEAGEYYEAALAIRDCQEDYPSLEQECDELMSQIAEALKDKEPKTGELERHFPFYGMNCVTATALTGPFEMTITDAENDSLYVRFYVRQGDVSEIYLPSSHYYVSINQGDIWFGDDVGFGELCESSDFGGDTLDMTSRSDGRITKYHTWSPVF